jgi:pyruvate/2-oxoglutarate dehydrogenase complex dihydrolipoamide acyltransferase (E2) component
MVRWWNRVRSVEVGDMSWEVNQNGRPGRTPDDRSGDGPRRISPYARRLAAQLSLQIADLVGTGPGGEVGAKDVRRAGAARAAAGSRIVISGTPTP